jgi:hypothetical protein
MIYDSHSDITDDISSIGMSQQLGQNLPRMTVSVDCQTDICQQHFSLDFMPGSRTDLQGNGRDIRIQEFLVRDRPGA